MRAGFTGRAGAGCVRPRKHGAGVRAEVTGAQGSAGLGTAMGVEISAGLSVPGSAARVSGRWEHGLRSAAPVPLSGRCAGRSRQRSSAPPPPARFFQRSAARCPRRGPAAMRDPTAALGAGQRYLHRSSRGGSRRREWGREGRGPGAEHGIGGGTGTGTGRGGDLNAGMEGIRDVGGLGLERGRIQGDTEHRVRILRVGGGLWVPGGPQP